MKKDGAGWIVYEEYFHERSRRLISILPARLTAERLAQFLRQIYVDNHLSLQERLSYRRSPNSAPYQVMKGLHCNPLHIGHEPSLIGIHAHSMVLAPLRRLHPGYAASRSKMLL